MTGWNQMTDSMIRPALEKIQSLVQRHAKAERHLPNSLAVGVLEHEHAVQFDEKRFDAPNHIRGLVNEALDREESGR